MAIKRGKWERQAAKRAASAPPEQLAADGVKVNRGNSNEVPLSPVGENEVAHVAQALADKGGVDSITGSTSVRAQQTADKIAKANPKPVQVQPEPKLESWAQGNLEGQPEAAVRNQVRALIRKHPDAVIPGQGMSSTRPGESFNQFRTRYLSAIRGEMQQLADNPNKRRAIVTHSTGLKVLKAWLKKGAPDDLSVDPTEMDKKAGEPGSVHHLFPNDQGDWEANKVDMDGPEMPPSGIFVVLHGATPDQQESYDRGEGQQKAIARITKQTKGLDFERVKNEAAKAVQAGHLSDDEVSDTIDAALPSAKELSDQPMPKVLAAIAAAGPAKRAEYQPLLQSHFGNIDSLPPEARDMLASHLQQITA